MFIDKFAQRVDNYIEKRFRRSVSVNFLYLFVTMAVEFVLFWFLAHSSCSDMLIAKIAALPLLADYHSRFFFAAWIIFTNQAKHNEKYLRAMHYLLLFVAVMVFVNFFVMFSSLFQ